MQDRNKVVILIADIRNDLIKLLMNCFKIKAIVNLVIEIWLKKKRS